MTRPPFGEPQAKAEPGVIPADHEFLTDGTNRNRCVYNYPDGKQCRKGNRALLHHTTVDLMAALKASLAKAAEVSR